MEHKTDFSRLSRPEVVDYLSARTIDGTQGQRWFGHRIDGAPAASLSELHPALQSSTSMFIGEHSCSFRLQDDGLGLIMCQAESKDSGYVSFCESCDQYGYTLASDEPVCPACGGKRHNLMRPKTVIQYGEPICFDAEKQKQESLPALQRLAYAVQAFNQVVVALHRVTLHRAAGRRGFVRS